LKKPRDHRHVNNCTYSHRYYMGPSAYTCTILKFFSQSQVKVWFWISSNVPSVSFSFSNWCPEPLVCICIRFNVTIRVAGLVLDLSIFSLVGSVRIGSWRFHISFCYVRGNVLFVSCLSYFVCC